MPLTEFFKRRLDGNLKNSSTSKSLHEDHLICNDFIVNWQKLNCDTNEPSLIYDTSINSVELQQEFAKGVRLLIFRESSGSKRRADGQVDRDGSGGGGRRLVFDSKILVPFVNDEGGSTRYRLRSKPANDTKLLGEMIFGTVSIANLTDCLKVHYIRFPPQIVLSRVFSPSALCSSSTVTNPGGEPYSGMTRSASGLSLAQRLEESLERVAAAQRQAEAAEVVPRPERSDSALSASVKIPVVVRPPPVQPSLPGSLGAGGISLTPGSNTQGMFLNSVHMRIVKSQLCAMTSYEEDDDGAIFNAGRPSSASRTRLGVSIILAPFSEEDVERNDKLKQFVFAHMALLEPMLFALCSEVVDLLTSTPSTDVLSRLVAALALLRTRLARLYLTERLQWPVWPLLTGLDRHRSKLEECFVRQCLCPAARRFSSSEKNNFTACVLTALLTHHLSWLSSVSPATGTPLEGYNPYWAQLNDLYGLLGFPKKMARTVVLGREASLVHFFVLFCSYFIRFNDIFLQDVSLPEHEVSSMDMEQVVEEVEVEQRTVSVNTTPLTPLSIMVNSHTPHTPSTHSGRPVHLVQLPLCDPVSTSPESLLRVSLGRSMLAGTSSSGYAPFFALQGVLCDPNSVHKVKDSVTADLQLALATDILDERLAEAAVIVADTTRWQVEVHIFSTGSSEPRVVQVRPADFIVSLLEEAAALCGKDMNLLPPPLVLEAMEGRLRELYSRSMIMGEHLRERRYHSHTSARLEDIASLSGGQASDVPLLVATAATHMGKYFPIGLL